MSGTYVLSLVLIGIFLVIPNLTWWGPSSRLFPMSQQAFGLCLILGASAFVLFGANAFCNPIEFVNWPSVEGTITDIKALAPKHSRKNASDIECKFKYMVNKHCYSSSSTLHQFTFLGGSNVKKGDKVRVHYNPAAPSREIGVELGPNSYPSMILHTAITVILVSIGLIGLFGKGEGSDSLFTNYKSYR